MNLEEMHTRLNDMDVSPEAVILGAMVISEPEKYGDQLFEGNKVIVGYMKERCSRFSNFIDLEEGANVLNGVWRTLSYYPEDVQKLAYNLILKDQENVYSLLDTESEDYKRSPIELALALGYVRESELEPFTVDEVPRGLVAPEHTKMTYSRGTDTLALGDLVLRDASKNGFVYMLSSAELAALWGHLRQRDDYEAIVSHMNAKAREILDVAYCNQSVIDRFFEDRYTVFYMGKDESIVGGKTYDTRDEAVSVYETLSKNSVSLELLRLIF